MAIFNFIIFILAMFSGCFFGVFILTCVEAKSQGFQNFTDKVHSIMPKKIWTLVTVTFAFAVALCLLKFTALTHSRAGILAGIISGIPVFFRAGSNINRKDMEKAAEEEEKIAREKKAQRDIKRNQRKNR